MIKKCLLLLLIFGFAKAKAQKDVGGYLHLNIGIVKPSGDFGSSDPNNNSAGFASAGPSIQATIGHKIQGAFGGFITFTNAFPFIDGDGLTKATSSSSSGYTWKTDFASWRLTGLNFGPQFSFNMKRSAFDIRLIAGAMSFYSPELELKGTSDNGSPEAVFKYLSTRTTSWTLGGGLCYKYEIKRGFVLLANAEYLISKPRFRDVQQELYIEGSGLVANEKVSYYQKFQVFNLQLGCGWVF